MLSYEVTDKKAEFIEALKTKCSVYHAATVAGISRMTAYRWRAADSEFATQWDDSLESAIDTLEASLYERALAGDNTCTIFFLKGNREKYRDRLTVDVNRLNSEFEATLAAIETGRESGISSDTESTAVN